MHTKQDKYDEYSGGEAAFEAFSTRITAYEVRTKGIRQGGSATLASNDSVQQATVLLVPSHHMRPAQ